ncbi:MAG: hypothetical protein ABSD72_18145 [Terracidiphilus sp.]|jgi:hypothetical protein
MTGKKTTELVSEIVDLLTPIESAERIRVIQASLTLLGEAFPAGSRQAGGAIVDPGEGDGSGTSALPTRARAWMKQNSVTDEELEQVFHLGDGSAEVIAGEIPGKGKKEQTLNAYILVGVSRLLSTGNPTFDDKSARSLCESLGCYDIGNHSVFIKDRGNEFAGTKEKGWTLTAPGLKRAATLVKEIAKS